MPPSATTAMSVVPPPMSTTMLPCASVTGSPDPMAAAMPSSTRCTSLTLARYALSTTARRSTWVMPDGIPITTRVRRQEYGPCALRMKLVSMRSAASKSAMTPSRIGRIVVMEVGVRPSIARAAWPTASVFSFVVLIATIDGSSTTMPRPAAKTMVLAVPRSMARSRAPKGRMFISTEVSVRVRVAPRNARLVPD